MRPIHIITPVKDSIQTTLQTIHAIAASKTEQVWDYTIYNDHSSKENTAILEKECAKYGFTLVNLSDITDHPSPNYLMILQMAQLRAIAEEAHLIIVESDVIIKENTIDQLGIIAERLPNAGLLGAVTVDTKGEINYPYLYAKKMTTMLPTRKRISFCCTLISNNFLNAFSFKELNPEKSWFDVFISHKALAMGYTNFILANLPVLHQPHSSRPWKHLKYSNPIKYYWLKTTKKLDRI